MEPPSFDEIWRCALPAIRGRISFWARNEEVKTDMLQSAACLLAGLIKKEKLNRDLNSCVSYLCTRVFNLIPRWARKEWRGICGPWNDYGRRTLPPTVIFGVGVDAKFYNPNPLARLESEEANRNLRIQFAGFLRSLTAKRRRAAWCRLWKGMSRKDTARKLHTSPQSISSIMVQVKQKAREWFNAYE